MSEPAAASTWSLAEPSARRSLILCALGAIIGLAIAGVGLFTARGTRSAGVPAEDVALVNQVPILMSDYLLQLRALYDVPLGRATAEQKRKTLDGMIREELYVQRGVELGLQSDTTEVRAALVGAVEAQSAADAVMAQPSEDDLRRYYREHLDSFLSEGVMALDDYVLPRPASPAAIAAAADALRAGSVAPGVSRTDTMADGDEFYFAARLHLGERRFAAARRLKAGEVSPPIDLPDGVHLLKMRRNVLPEAPSYAEARDKVLAAFIAAQTATLTAANERFLRKRADIQIARGYG